MSSVLGGGAKDAKRQAEIARSQQRIANDRQLAELNRASEKAILSRAAPRGRRLFADAGDSQLKNTLG